MCRRMHAGRRSRYPVGVEVSARRFGQHFAGDAAGRHAFPGGARCAWRAGDDGVAVGADDRGDVGEVDGTGGGFHAEPVGGVVTEPDGDVVGPVGRVQVVVVGGRQINREGAGDVQRVDDRGAEDRRRRRRRGVEEPGRTRRERHGPGRGGAVKFDERTGDGAQRDVDRQHHQRLLVSLAAVSAALAARPASV